MDKNALEHLLSSYNWGMGISTVAVAVGILGEYVAHFAFEKEARSNKREMAVSILFGVLVLGGVGGEYIFGNKLSQVSEQLQRIADTEVANANGAAESARMEAEIVRKQSADTNERAANAERHAAQENERASLALKAAEVARKSAEGFQLQIAQANERALKNEKEAAQLRKDAEHLNREAESEHLARVKLEQLLSWRSLTADQNELIARNLRPFLGQQFDFVTYENEGECLNFRNVLYRAFLSSGWVVDPKRKWGMLLGLVVGIEVQVSAGADKPTRDAASALLKALNHENLSATLNLVPLQDAPKNEVIKIAIGRNPASMQPIQ